MFAELMHQKALYPATEQFRMHDSVSNGNMRQLEQLCDLIIENRVSVKFNLENAVIRKEMDERLYRKLRHAGCTLIGYGLESPSKPLLKNVGKMACLDADFEKVVKDGVRCGMTIGINMMFGLPGEKDEDFRGQLAFIRRLRKYRRGIIVNPALNFCYFPPGSEVFASPEKYDVDMAGGELYWESRDGQNTFLRRLARFEEFCETARKLGYSNLFGVTQNSNKQALIGQYYMVKQDHEQALHYFLRSFAGEVKTAELAREILRLYEKTARPMDEAGTQVARYVAEEDGVGAPGAGTLETVRELEEYVLRSSLIHSMRRIRGFVQARPKAIRSHPAGLWPRLRSRLQGNVLRVFEQLLHKVDDRDVLWEEMLREVDNKIEAALAARRRNGEERSGEPANEGGRGMSGLRGPAWAHDTEASRSGGDDGNSA